MFGILEVRESDGTNLQRIVAESGPNFSMQNTVAAAGLAATHYVTQLDIAAMANTYRVCDATPAAPGTVIAVQGIKFTCAATKLVQYFAHNLRAQYQNPVLYMT